MGIDLSLDLYFEVIVVLVVIGVCMFMIWVLFDFVRGWDNGYLIGDFEDFDLCFKIWE